MVELPCKRAWGRVLTPTFAQYWPLPSSNPSSFVGILHCPTGGLQPPLAGHQVKSLGRQGQMNSHLAPHLLRALGTAPVLPLPLNACLPDLRQVS